MLQGTNRVELGILPQVLGPGNIDKDVRECLDSVGIAAHHHVAETNIVVSAFMFSYQIIRDVFDTLELTL